MFKVILDQHASWGDKKVMSGSYKHFEAACPNIFLQRHNKLIIKLSLNYEIEFISRIWKKNHDFFHGRCYFIEMEHILAWIFNRQSFTD